MTPERLFDRRWALTLLDRVIGLLGEEYAHAGKSPLFERLKDALIGESVRPTYAQVAADLGMTEVAIKVAAHRLRKNSYPAAPRDGTTRSPRLTRLTMNSGCSLRPCAVIEKMRVTFSLVFVRTG